MGDESVTNFGWLADFYRRLRYGTCEERAVALLMFIPMLLASCVSIALVWCVYVPILPIAVAIIYHGWIKPGD